MRLLKGLFLPALICTALIATAKAQKVPPVNDRQEKPPTASGEIKVREVGENDVVRITTSLVRVPVSVRDRQGRYINDLQKEDFKIYENGTEQQIALFGGVEEPVSVVLLIDVSCSILEPRDTIKAALAFIDQLRPADSVLPIAFGQNIYALLTESTRDRAILRERILGLPDGKQTPCDRATRLGDAVEFVINHILRNGTGRRAVLLLSDGSDSMISKQGWGTRTLRAVSELGVPFYSIRLETRWDQHCGGGVSKLQRPEDVVYSDLACYVNDLASLSGGRSFPARSGEDLKSFFMQIGEELRHQYMLAYYPASSEEKVGQRKIKVRVNKKDLSVRARQSYTYIPPAR
jgi:Ca-activated chloride channel homolog